jgi:histidyl-tRNA synthetase
MSKTQPARGMRDFLPGDVKKRNYVINIIREVYESYGFEPLETPSVENLETLTGKYGEEGNGLIFKILKRGEKLDTELAEGKITSENQLSDLALRYDLTVPLARVVANNKNELPKFFKRYQIQPVWRADRPARGRYREFYQCDVDAIGSKSMLVEAELCAAVSEILVRLGFKDFEIRVNHRQVLADVLNAAGISIEKQTDALVAIDKLDKIGRVGVEKEFIDRGISADSSKKLLDLFDKVRLIKEQETNINGTTLESLAGFAEDETLTELRQLLNLTINAPLVVDPTLARGLSYYTGAIFEIALTIGDFAGSIGGGGRYDGLIGMFGKEQIPACGFSLGLERILLVMDERAMFPPELEMNAADVLVTVMAEESAGESLKLASELREKGLRVLVYPETDKLGKQFKYADSIGISYVCVLGETEIAENTVTLKNLKTGTQETVSREEIAGKIKMM